MRSSTRTVSAPKSCVIWVPSWSRSRRACSGVRPVPAVMRAGRASSTISSSGRTKATSCLRSPSGKSSKNGASSSQSRSARPCTAASARCLPAVGSPLSEPSCHNQRISSSGVRPSVVATSSIVQTASGPRAPATAPKCLASTMSVTGGGPAGVGSNRPRGCSLASIRDAREAASAGTGRPSREPDPRAMPSPILTVSRRPR
jgi:hypothetical protein